MKLSKFSKKLIAYLCAIAMVVSGLVFAPSNDAAADDYSDLTFKVSNNNPDIAVAFVTQGGVTTDQEVNYCLDQGDNFYCATTAAFTKPDFKKVSCNDNVEDPARAGANFWIPMSVLNDNAYNVVTIDDAVGNKAQFVIRKGTPTEPTTETPTEEPTTVEPSTEAPTEEPTTEAPATEWASARDQWALRKADGTFENIADGGASYDGFNGIASFYSGSWGGGAVDVKAPTPDDPDKLDINVISAGTGGWSMQAHVNKTGLDASKTYKASLSLGKTVLEDETFSGKTAYTKTYDLAGKLPVGEGTLELTIEEQTKPDPPVVKTITITPNTGQIEANRNLWANWEVPEGSSKVYVYINQAGTGYDVIAANGWDFNAESQGQPRNAIDNGAHTKNNEITVTEGETYTLIVNSYDAWDQQTGHGEVEITIPGLTPEEKEAKEFLGKINTEENLALNKTAIVDSHTENGYKICDGSNGTMWQADKTVSNSSFAVDLGQVYTVDKVLVSWEASNARAYEVYVAGDDQDYGTTPVATVTDLPNNTAVYRLSKGLNTQARYIKVVVTQLSGNAEAYGIAPYELAAFGTESPTEEPTTEAPTQEPTTESGGIVMDIDLPCPETDNNYQVGGYNVYTGGWDNCSAVAGVDADNSDHVKMAIKTTNNWEVWSLQISKGIDGLTAGEEYDIEWTIKANKDDGTVTPDFNGVKTSLTGAEQTLTGTAKANDAGVIKLIIGVGNVGIDNAIEYSQPIVKDKSGNVVYPKTEPTTEAPTQEPTTEAPTQEPTTEAPTQEPTTEAPTQAPTEKPTVAPTTEEMPTPVPIIKIPDKAKVKKIAKKKKSAKKLKVTISKVSGAKGYQVQVSKSKKGKALVKKYTTKTKVTIKSKKLKKKKKLYVKVRAYTLDGTVKVFGEWSKPKKAKIKK